MNSTGEIMKGASALVGVTVLATVTAVVAVNATSGSAAEQADAPSSIVEDFTYPGAEAILAQHGLKLFKGDGHIVFESARLFGESQCPTGLIQVEKHLDAEPYGVWYCFRMIGPKGLLTLEIPGTFGVRGGSETIQVKAKLPDNTVLPTYEVPPNQPIAIEPGGDDETPQAILVEIRNE
ncbi:hypothetical protein ACQP08_09845 [Micromonospora zamorensis]|uniref:hypothetical protein n=1 Tax=Micromonospora zamorensis TaxID=709883 RepID=UPI003D8B1828